MLTVRNPDNEMPSFRGLHCANVLVIVPLLYCCSLFGIVFDQIMKFTIRVVLVPQYGVSGPSLVSLSIASGSKPQSSRFNCDVLVSRRIGYLGVLAGAQWRQRVHARPHACHRTPLGPHSSNPFLLDTQTKY